MSYIKRKPINENQLRESVKSQETQAAINELEKAVDEERLKRANDDQQLAARIEAFKEEYDSQVSVFEAAHNDLFSDIALTAAALTASDTAILNTLASEVALREASEGAMRKEYNGGIDAEKSARMKADEELKAALMKEVSAQATVQAAADEKLRAEISSETAIRTAAIKTLQDAISAEATSRAGEDAKILTAVSNEATARNNADTALKNSLVAQISSETTLRVAAINDLRTEINSTLADNLNDFTKTKHGLVPVPPSGNTEQILTQNGWRPVTSSTIYINELPSQFGTLTYSGQPQNVTFQNYDANKLTLTGKTSATDAGNYTATFTPKGLYVWGADNTQNAKNVQWNIGVLKLTKPAATSTQFNYTGAAINLNVNNFNGTYMTQSGTLSATNAGNYTATYALKNKSNTTWADGSTANVAINWTISQNALSAELSSGFEQVGTLTYSGANQTVTIKNYNEQWHTLSGDLTKTDAGTYTAVIAPKAGHTWSDGSTGGKSVTWKIEPMKLTKPAANTISFTYDGAAKNLQVQNVDAAYMTQTGTLSATATGDYSVTYALKNKTNTTWADGTTADVVINWAIGSLRLNKPAANTTSFTYSGNAKNLVVSNFDAAYMTQAGTLTATDAGSYSATYTLKEPSKVKWSDGSTGAVTITWTIERAKLTATQSNITSGAFPTYSGQSQSITINNYDANYHTLTGTTSAINAGNYTATVAPKSNYCWSDGSTAAKNIQWQITRKLLTVANDEVVNYTYSGAQIAFAFEGVSQDLINSSDITLTGATSATNAGDYSVTYHLASDNYDWQRNAATTHNDFSVTHRIKRKPLSAALSTFAQSGTLTYNAAAQSVAINNYDANYHILGGTTSASDAGSYTATVAPKSNYCWVNGSTDAKNVSWVINQLSLNKPSADPLEFTFDGEDHLPTVTGFNATFMSSANINDAKSAAGAYQITIDLKSPDNTRWADGSTDTCVIDWSIGMTKVNLPDVIDEDLIYDGTELSPSFNFDSDTVTLTGTTSAINQGRYAVVFTLKDADKTIWSDGSTEAKSATWTIQRKPLPAAISTFAQSGELFFNRTQQTVTLQNFDDNYLSMSNQTRIYAGDYIAYVYLKSNYCWNDGSTERKAVPWKIKPIKLEKPVMTSDSSFIYDKETHSPTFDNVPSVYIAKSGDISESALGDYSVTFSIKRPDSVQWVDDSTDDISFNWTIVKRPIKKPSYSGSRYNYNPKGHEVTFTGFQEDYMTLEGTIAATDTGTYSLSLALKDPETCCWTDGSTDTWVINWVIRPVDVGNIRDTLFVPEYTFNGKQQSCQFYTYNSITGQPQTSSLTFYFNTSGTMRATDAGTYPISVTPKPGYIWHDGSSDTRVFDWIINPLPIDEVSAGDDLIFNGQMQEPSIINFVDSAMTLTGTTEASNAGLYKATVELKDNYCWQDGTTKSIKITWAIRRQPIPEEIASQIITHFSKPYTGKAYNLSTTECNINTTYLYWTNVDTAIEVGTYRRLAAYPKTNYCWQDGTNRRIYVYLTIYDPDEDSSTGIRAPVITSQPEFTYDGNAHSITLSYNENFSEIKTGTLSATDAGEYSVTLKLKGSGYTWKDGTTADKTLTWSIARKPLSESKSNLIARTLFYTGQPQNVIIYGFDSKYCEKSGTLIATAAGDYKAKVTLKPNYCWADGTIADKSIDWQIQKHVVSYPKKLQQKTFEYDGKAKTIAFNKELDEKWLAVDGTVTATDAGNYSVTISLKEPDNTALINTTATSHVLSWKIEPMKLTKPAAEQTEYTYTGAKINLQVSDFNSTYMSVSGLNSATHVADTKDGKGKAIYSIKDKENCTWADGSTADVEINWQIVKALIPAQYNYDKLRQSNSLTYNRQLQQVEIANYNNTYHILIGGYMGYNYGATAAGSYVAGIEPKPDYTWQDGSTDIKSVPWTINKAPRSYSLPSAFVDSFTLDKIGASDFTISSADPSICSVAVNDSTFTLTPGKNGSTFITVAQEEDSSAHQQNYLAFSATFQVDIKRSLSNFTWAQIAAFTKAGNLLDYCQIGDVKEIFLDASSLNNSIYGTYGVVLIGYNHNPDLEGSNRAHFLIGKLGSIDIAFIGTDYNTESSWPAFTGSIHFYAKTNNPWFAALPADLQPLITACKKSWGYIGTRTEKIWSLHKSEIDGSYRAFIKQYEYFKNGNGLKRMDHAGNKFVYWWTRSAPPTETEDCYAVSGNGSLEGTAYHLSLGVVPCFTIS